MYGVHIHPNGALQWWFFDIFKLKRGTTSPYGLRVGTDHAQSYPRPQRQFLVGVGVCVTSICAQIAFTKVDFRRNKGLQSLYSLRMDLGPVQMMPWATPHTGSLVRVGT